ncbi:MAG: hypothetical protein ACRDUV_25270 [Pseudonocardiaceae bacterium]
MALRLLREDHHRGATVGAAGLVQAHYGLSEVRLATLAGSWRR